MWFNDVTKFNGYIRIIIIVSIENKSETIKTYSSLSSSDADMAAVKVNTSVITVLNVFGTNFTPIIEDTPRGQTAIRV